MAEYASSYTGSQIDDLLTRAGYLSSVGKAPSAVLADTATLAATSSSCSGNSATASKLATARTIALTGSVTGSGSFDGSGNLSISTSTNHTHSQYMIQHSESLYFISKNTDSGSTITITVPGHANTGYDRICILCFGNMNGQNWYGNLITTSSSDGTSPSAGFVGNQTCTCTYANSGSDRIITISGLPAWGVMCFISKWQIT